MMVTYDWLLRFFVISSIVHDILPEKENQLVLCVVAICKQDFAPSQVVVVDGDNILGDAQATLLRILHSQVTWTFIHENHHEITQDVKSRGTIGRDDCYILFARQDGFAFQLARMRSRTSWNSRALFLVVLTSTPNLILQIFEDLWKHKVANAVVISPTDNISSNNLNIYSWFPYQKSSCSEVVKSKDIVIVNQWKNGQFLYNKYVFATKVPNDLHGCPVYVSTFPWSPFIINESLNNQEIKYKGLEIEMMNTIGKAANFKPVYLPPPPNNTRWGWKESDGQWYGAMAEVIYGRANVTMASLIYTLDRVDDFDTTKFYMTNALVWVVPRAKQIPQWQSLFKIFSPILWMCTLTTLLVTATVFRCSCICKDLKSCLFLSLAMLIGVSVNPQSKKHLLFACYTFYCLLINAAYQSCLISFLTEPLYYKQITTEREARDSGMKIHTCCGYNQFFDKHDPVSVRIANCTTHQQCLNEVINEDIVAVGDKALLSNIISSAYIDDNGQSKVLILSDNILLYYVGMMFAKGNILLERFNQIIYRINEAGLMLKWKQDLNQLKYKNESQIHQSQQTMSGLKCLTLTNLHGAFLILLFGHIFALFTMLCEITSVTKFRTSTHNQ